ncbi:LamG domain-containing protein [Candidatus Poribacteria bacterium]|jgi:hypothetical protein|nr:LamG domain-containing protein [Candidatus Poribacteria bacterium]
MYRVLRGMTGVALMALFAVSAYAKIDAGTVGGVWLFDEASGDVASDSSGNGNGGSLTGGVEWVDGPSNALGSALRFDGTGYVGIPDSDSLDMTDSMTVVFWVRSEKPMVDMWADRQVVVGKHYEEYEIGIYLDGQIHTYSSDLAVDYDEGILVSFDGQLPDGDADWIEGKWYHVAWTLDGTHEVAYVNGVMLGEFDKGHSGTLGGDHALDIGQREGGGLNVTGAVDDVGVFNVALTADDISMVYEQGLAVAALGATAVEPEGKLAATWGALKSR